MNLRPDQLQRIISGLTDHDREALLVALFSWRPPQRRARVALWQASLVGHLVERGYALDTEHALTLLAEPHCLTGLGAEFDALAAVTATAREHLRMSVRTTHRLGQRMFATPLPAPIEPLRAGMRVGARVGPEPVKKLNNTTIAVSPKEGK